MKYDSSKAVEMILDENCDRPIVLTDNNGEKHIFEQIATIPFDKRMFVILVEKEDYESGNTEEAGYVFEIDTDNMQLYIVDNDETISHVFEIYDRLFEEIN